ncbi:MAG: hypothetical protein MZU97_16590 [Bacillus subtilis]|nr:hypothetical protein [Bacillus subtilis]
MANSSCQSSNRSASYDWRATVAMLTGFVAKESVVGTLGHSLRRRGRCR